MLQKPGTELLAYLKSVVGPAGIVEPQDAHKYFIDLRGHFQGSAALVIRPSTTGQVSQILSACNNERVGIVPYGGGTGGSAGHIDTKEKNMVVLSLERMARVRSINVQDNVLIAEAGCILADIQSCARKHNRRFGLSLASEGSCTIGGNLASNAGGIQVIKYGNARDLCLGVEAVMPDGSILDDANVLRKNNTGYDIRHLLIGSEGTLGIITGVSLKLAPLPRTTTTVMCAINTPSCAVESLQRLQDTFGEIVCACELMSDLGVNLAVKHFPDLRMPFDQHHTWYVLIEIVSQQAIRKSLETYLADNLGQMGVVDAIVAQSDAQASMLWKLREYAFEYNRKEGVLYSSDTSVPISQIERFIEQVSDRIHQHNPGLRVNCYGHIGDGNIHVNVFPPESVAKQPYLDSHPHCRLAIHQIINEVTVQCCGSISAEHGIGRLKTDELRQYADPTRLAMMKSIKKALDPNGIMNPGALFGE